MWKVNWSTWRECGTNKKIWVPNRNWTHDLLNTRQCSKSGCGTLWVSVWVDCSADPSSMQEACHTWTWLYDLALLSSRSSMDRAPTRCFATNAIILNLTQLLCYSEKVNLRKICNLALLRQANILLVKVNNAKSTNPPMSSGEECGFVSWTAAGNLT